MRATEFVTESRGSLFAWVKQQFPTWPDYVLKDFLYPQAKGIRDQAELEDFIKRNKNDFGQVKWRLEQLPITMDIFTPKTQRMIISREGGLSNPYDVPRDAERHAQQSRMLQQTGVSREPIIVAKLSNGYDLIEGWHRTIQHLKAFPEGYTAPAWVAYGATYQSVAEGLNESAYEEAWELISQPVPEIQQFVKQLGLAQDDATAKQIAPMIDAAPDIQLPASNIPKLKNLANKGNDVQTLKAIQQISGRPDAAQQYAKLMQTRDAGEGRNRGYDVSGLIKSVQTGNYESPVLLKLPKGLYVIGGRTRLYAALALNIPAKVKIISADNFKQGVAEATSSNIVTFFRGEPILSQERLNQLKSSIGKPYPILRKKGSAANIGTYMSPDGNKATSFVQQALAGQGKGGAVTQIQVDPNSFSKGDGGIDEAVIITNIAGLVSDQKPNKNDPLRIQDRKQAMLKYLGPGVRKYLNDPLLSDPKMVQRWYNPEFAEKNWNTIKSGKQAVTKPGVSQIQERMIHVLGPLAEKIRRDPEIINYFISHNPGNWIEYNFRMNSDGSGTKVVDVKYYPPSKKQGLAEGQDLEEIENIPAYQFSGGKDMLDTHELPNKKKLRPLPGGTDFKYSIDQDGHGQRVTIVDPDTTRPQVVAVLHLDPGNYLPNTVQVGSITVDEDYRGRGLAKALYGIVLTVMRKNLLSGGAQTPSGRRNWMSLAAIPGVEVNGLVRIPNQIFDLGRSATPTKSYQKYADRTIDQIMELGGQYFGKNNHSSYWLFDVVPGKGQLQPAVRNRLSKLYGYDADNLLLARWTGQLVNEVNIDTEYNPDELTVRQRFIDYFTGKGYQAIGEGRDQIAFQTPRGTVLKVLGLGDEVKQQAVEHYVEFFERNQRNPYYPKIYNSQRFEFEGDSYFLYETEYLQYVSNEGDTLDWLEHYLNLLGTDPVQAHKYIETNGIPNDIGEDQLHGLTQSTEDIIEYLAGPRGYMMDLSNIENIRRRADGHLVIVDPISV